MYTASRPFINNKGRIQKFKETKTSRNNYQNELNKVCIQHGIA